MKKTLWFLCLTLVVLSGFAYRTAFFYQDFSAYPVGPFTVKTLPNNDDGTHGSNDACGKTLLDNFTDRFFYLDYQKPLAVVDWQFGRALKINTAQTGAVVFEARNLPVTGDRDFELELRYFINWEHKVDPHWVLFRNYDPGNPKRDFDRLLVTYENGHLSLSVALPGKTDFETVFSKKIYLPNAWHTFTAKKTGNNFVLMHDSGELFSYRFATTPAWPFARVELHRGSFNFDRIAFFNGR